MKPKKKVRWNEKPDDGDYPSDGSYLSLIFDTKKVSAIQKALRSAPVVQFKAKDICRAAELPLLDRSNEDVAKDLAKIAKGEMLPPILLVRDKKRHRVIIVDGYHRMCAVYISDENEIIRCKIV